MKINYSQVAQMMKAASGYKNTPRVAKSIYDNLVKVENAPVVFLNNDRKKPQLSATAYRQTKADAKQGNKQAEQVLRIAKAIRGSSNTAPTTVSTPLATTAREHAKDVVAKVEKTLKVTLPTEYVRILTQGIYIDLLHQQSPIKAGKDTLPIGQQQNWDGWPMLCTADGIIHVTQELRNRERRRNTKLPQDTVAVYNGGEGTLFFITCSGFDGKVRTRGYHDDTESYGTRREHTSSLSGLTEHHQNLPQWLKTDLQQLFPKSNARIPSAVSKPSSKTTRRTPKSSNRPSTRPITSPTATK